MQPTALDRARNQPEAAEDQATQPGASDQDLVSLVQTLPPGDPRRESACETLVGRYQSIVRSCAQRYRDSPEPAEDLTQVGYVGLLKAINNFDPAYGNSLAAYAQPCVSGEIKRHFRDKRWHIRVRRMTQELRLEIRGATAELTQELSRMPRDGELAERLQVTEADIRETRVADQAFQAASLDAPIDDDGQSATFGDFLGADDPAIEQAVDMESVWTHWQELPDREQRLLTMRFYGNMTQAQIGEQLGISQMHVSRLLTRALDYLREHVSDAPARPCPQD
ncbi:MAG TPA: SigB/SigF/SigG family RNA polymerase sigma factor [Streptosporangiaceae bacterium]|nr:SigB/SigF/SigG family RNA polymerase sigma factor [Streptosporangiaceae bacterium]